MSMKKMIVNLLIVLFPFLCWGQSTVNEQINAIMMDENYLYAEFSHEDPSLAYENAVHELLALINEVRQEKDKAILQTNDIVVHVKELSYDRGDVKLVFVYLPIEDALSLTARESKNIPIQVKEETRPTAISPSEKVAHQPSHPANTSQPITKVKPINQDEVVSVLFEIQMMDDIGGFMQMFQSEGKVSAFGIPHSMNDIPNDAYLILYDRSRAIQAILSPQENGQRINLRTMETDQITRYSGHGVFWFKK